MTTELLHEPSIARRRQTAAPTHGALLISAALLSACGGGGKQADAGAATAAEPARAYKAAAVTTAAATTTEDAVRLAHQASFGPTEALVAEIRTQGAAGWIRAQQSLAGSRYTLGSGDAIHRTTASNDFCSLPAYAGPYCWRDWYSTQPLLWDFYRNAMGQPDQLRQRVAFAMQQILVVNSLEVQGTYGFRQYHNTLLDLAFGNYRELLRKVTLSPVMGDFLDHVNNDAAAPNENYARELLQLFSLGTCLLNPDGSIAGGKCSPVYNNDDVRAYAQALTGWTYPVGGATPWGCLPRGTNCRHYGGDMVPVAALRDSAERTLLSGVKVAAGSTAAAALDRVLDSLMQHPNIGPFVGRQLIQHLVSSNPAPAYVQRVGAAFNAGRYTAGGHTFGTGQPGDMAATVAAVLLDAEARASATQAADGGGKLREPVLYFTGVLRALNGRTDGEVLGAWWGEALRQHVFRPPSVFSFYAMDFPLVETPHVAPSFGIHNAGSAFDRLNYLTFLLQWGGAAAQAEVPGATGTAVTTATYEADAGTAAVLVDRLATVATGAPLAAEARSVVIQAVETITSAGNPQWRSDRVRQAAYLVFASPQYQVYR